MRVSLDWRRSMGVGLSGTNYRLGNWRRRDESWLLLHEYFVETFWWSNSFSPYSELVLASVFQYAYRQYETQSMGARVFVQFHVVLWLDAFRTSVFYTRGSVVLGEYWRLLCCSFYSWVSYVSYQQINRYASLLITTEYFHLVLFYLTCITVWLWPTKKVHMLFFNIRESRLV